MKTSKINVIVFALLATIFLSSCHDDDMFGVRGEGPVVTETRAIDDFDQIDLKVSGEVYITQGSTQEVRIEAQRNILDILDTDVRNGKLEIDFGRHWARRHKEIKVYITVPEITGLKVSGSGKIIGQSDFSTGYLDADISGSGNIDFSVVDTETIDADISGSGNMNLYGNSQNLKMDISGSGKLRAFELTAENADIKISGSGNSDVFVEQHLKARVSGSGRINYKGNPTVDVNVSGSGKVVNVN
jgi:hypothetical protein